LESARLYTVLKGNKGAILYLVAVKHLHKKSLA
jgi:hypothetical protein